MTFFFSKKDTYPEGRIPRILGGHDSPFSGLIEDPKWSQLERFVGRLLRRDFINAACSLSPQSPEGASLPWNVVFYGSSVVQLFRPRQGFLFSRRPRDIDISYTIGGNQAETNKAFEARKYDEQVQEYLTRAAKQINATAESPLSDGSRILRKTYQAKRIVQQLREKNEGRYIPEVKDTEVEIALEPLKLRSPIYPLIKRNNCFFEDIHETLGYKVARMTGCGQFEIRDVVDIFNVTAEGMFQTREDIEKIRLAAIVMMGFTISDPRYCGDYMDQVATGDLEDRAGRLQISEANARIISSVASDFLQTVFPRDQPGASPEKAFNNLHLTQSETRFLYGIAGLESAGRPLESGPVNLARLLVSGYRTIDSPEAVMERIQGNYFLSGEMKGAVRRFDF